MIYCDVLLWHSIADGLNPIGSPIRMASPTKAAADISLLSFWLIICYLFHSTAAVIKNSGEQRDSFPRFWVIIVQRDNVKSQWSCYSQCFLNVYYLTYTLLLAQ